MKKTECKKGMMVQLSGRTAEIIEMRQGEAKVKPAGESGRWVRISDLKKVDN